MLERMDQYLDIAKVAAQSAATLLRSQYSMNAGVTIDVAKDLKTKADLAAQEVVLAVLETTGIPVLSEEQTDTNTKPDISGRLWVVDPLDGTLNFSRGFAMAAVSIALWEEGEPVLGLVHDVHHGIRYSGIVGKGAWCDDQPMRVSAVNKRDRAILATGFPSGRSYDTEPLLSFVQSVQSYKKVRMLGSAALMLAQIAAGHFDVYEEEDIYLWDVAAGLALVRAAGGYFRMEPGSRPLKFHVRATNGKL